MNQGQYEGIIGVLREIRDLIKEQQNKPTISEANKPVDVSDIVNNLSIETDEVLEKPRRGRPRKIHE